jgi:two-component system sensor histidine kinase MtrB
MNARPDRTTFPGRLRRRLAVMFVVVAGLSAGALAIGAAVITASYRVDQFNDRARLNVQRDLRILAAGAPSEVVAARLRDRERPGGSAVVVIQDGDVVTSVDSLTDADIPAGMRRHAGADPGTVVQGEADLDGASSLVLGTVDESTGVELYFFFPREEVQRSISDLRTTLAIGWVVVVAVAGLFGTVVARRALRPVRTAADAARSVAEGLLDTRLPVRGDDEFGEWATSFNRMVAALEEKIHALAAASEREHRFTADVAHELRTPLSAVLAAASHLEQRADDVPADLAEVTQLLVGAARRLDRLTSELLELHRLEGGQETLHIEAVDLGSAIAGATNAHGWRDRVRIDEQRRIVVETDRRRFDRIVVNLVANALQHGGTDARVWIGSDGGEAVVAVSDDGPGIAPEHLPHVFERHFKATADRGVDPSASGGSGLGLSIAHESAQRIGGRIEVTSTPGAGATFVVRLPLERDEDDRDAEQGDDEHAEAASGLEDPPREPERAAAQQRVGDR